jgi:hypothetical protein
MANREDNGANREAIPLLIDVNKLGLMTVESQLGVIGEKTAQGQQYFERAYLSGFMPAARAKAFLTAMNLTTDKICVAAAVLPNGRDVSLHRVTVTKTLLPSGQWQSHTRWCPFYPRNRYLFQAKTAGLSHRLVEGTTPKVVLIEMMDAKWGRESTAPVDGLLWQVHAVLTAMSKSNAHRTHAGGIGNGRR